MTTARRVRRDRRRYNAFRRFIASTRIRPFWESYDAVRRAEVVTIIWRGWTRCNCGKRRQSLRLK